LSSLSSEAGGFSSGWLAKASWARMIDDVTLLSQFAKVLILAKMPKFVFIRAHQL
jgi:hypothetical protein